MATKCNLSDLLRAQAMRRKLSPVWRVLAVLMEVNEP